MNKKRPGEPGKNYISEALKLRINNGLSYNKIARTLSVPVSSLYQSIKPLEVFLKNVTPAKAYELSKTDILSAIEMKLAQELLNKSKLRKASLNNVAYSFKMVNEVNRLEKMLPTSIGLDLTPQLQEMIDKIVNRNGGAESEQKTAHIINNYLIEDKTECSSSLSSGV